MKPLLSVPDEGLPGMTRAPRPPIVETAAAAATAGATVGAVGEIEELGENASLRVYDPPPSGLRKQKFSLINAKLNLCKM